jgi:uncharacterized protein (DUF1810 family)
MSDDPYNLNRFLESQDRVYSNVLSELKSGNKQTHWIWYIFPQLSGLGRSPTSQYYAIKSKPEAVSYLNHPILGARLKECTEILLGIENKTAREILGRPDDLKFRSSMTLFAYISGPGSVFEKVLEKYFHGDRCHRTLSFLKAD